MGKLLGLSLFHKIAHNNVRPLLRSMLPKIKDKRYNTRSTVTKKNITKSFVYSSRGNQIQNLLTSMQSNQTIKTNYFLIKPMPFSNLRLHLTTTRPSTFSGFNLALLGVTTLPATEKTRSDLDEAAGIGKTTLTILDRRGNWAS